MKEKIKRAMKRYLIQYVILFCILVYGMVKGADMNFLSFILLLILVEQVNHNEIMERQFRQ